MAINKIDY